MDTRKFFFLSFFSEYSLCSRILVDIQTNDFNIPWDFLLNINTVSKTFSFFFSETASMKIPALCGGIKREIRLYCSTHLLLGYCALQQQL